MDVLSILLFAGSLPMAMVISAAYRDGYKGVIPVVVWVLEWICEESRILACALRAFEQGRTQERRRLDRQCAGNWTLEALPDRQGARPRPLAALPGEGSDL